jgi:hypothetical protein
VLEHRRVDAARELAQLVERLADLLARGRHEAGGGVGVVADAVLGEAERDGE